MHRPCRRVRRRVYISQKQSIGQQGRCLRRPCCLAATPGSQPPARLDATPRQATVIFVKSTVSISEGQNNFPALIKAAEKGRIVTVTRHDEPVACVMSYERMAAVAETLELMSSPAAVQAVAEHKAGRTEFGDLDDIPE
jgi:prevent-host-death family protein